MNCSGHYFPQLEGNSAHPNSAGSKGGKKKKKELLLKDSEFYC